MFNQNIAIKHELQNHYFHLLDIEMLTMHFSSNKADLIEFLNTLTPLDLTYIAHNFQRKIETKMCF